MNYRKKQLLVAFGLPFLLCIILLIGNGVYPFGEQCILHVDMYHQYCPFFTEFLDKLRHGGSLMYSWNIGLGSDFISVYAYYLASPLNWLLILCPSGFVIEFMTILIVLKISFSGFSFFIFLREHYGFENDNAKVIPAYIFALTYAFSGFVAAYSWDIMWMDCIALAPLIILGLEKLVKEGKVALYYVSLAVSILANYYISMMICMFLVFYFVLLFVRQKENRGIAFVRFTIYSLLAGGTGVVLMLPEMKILSYSGSSGMNFPKTVEWYFNIVAELSRMCTTAEVYTGTSHWPNLYTGAFSILLIFLYAFNQRIPNKKKLPGIAMIAFFIISFANNYLDFIWHGLHFPDSLPGRQSFLFSFVLLVIGYETFIQKEGVRIRDIALSIVLVLGIIYASYLLTDSAITDPIAFLITALFVACYGIIFILLKLKANRRKALFTELLYAIMVVEVFVNMATTGFYTTSRTAYMKEKPKYDKLLEMAAQDSGEGSFYRVENTERLTKNDDAKYGFKAATQFSSLMNINVSHFYQKLYMEGGKNYYSYNGATPISSAILSVKYLILSEPDAQSDTLTLVGHEQDQYLYRNNYCLPLGFVMDEAAAESFESSTAKDIAAINALGGYLGATDATLVDADCRVTPAEGKTEIVFHENGHFYARYNTCSADSLTFEFSNGSDRRYGKTTHKYLFDLGYHRAGESVSISNSKMESIHFTAYRLNIDAVDTAYANLSRQTMELTDYSDTEVKGHIDVKEPGRLILSIPNEEGWSLYVNGTKTDVTSFAETFISVYLKEGSYDIELKYETPGLKAGAIFSTGCVAVFLLLLLYRRAKRKKYEETNQCGGSVL